MDAVFFRLAADGALLLHLAFIVFTMVNIAMYAWLFWRWRTRRRSNTPTPPSKGSGVGLEVEIIRRHGDSDGVAI